MPVDTRDLDDYQMSWSTTVFRNSKLLCLRQAMWQFSWVALRLLILDFERLVKASTHSFIFFMNDHQHLKVECTVMIWINLMLMSSKNQIAVYYKQSPISCADLARVSPFSLFPISYEFSITHPVNRTVATPFLDTKPVWAVGSCLTVLGSIVLNFLLWQEFASNSLHASIHGCVFVHEKQKII